MRKIILLSLVLFSSITLAKIPMYFCTAADHKYFEILKNFIGSIHATNFDNTQEIAVYDLGLTSAQKSWLSKVQKVTINEIELTNPELLKPFKRNAAGMLIPGWYAWKPVIIKQSLEKFPYVLWLDAGMTIKKPLDHLFIYLKENGYFLSTIGDEGRPDGTPLWPISWGTTKFVKENFLLNKENNKWILNQEFVNGGIIGASQKTIDLFIMPLYEMTKNLKFYEDDGSTPDGFGCGRHDQTLLSIIAYLLRLEVQKIDYSQKKPALLQTNLGSFDFYLTHDRNFVCDKTDIYHSRGDISQKNYYLSKIKYK